MMTKTAETLLQVGGLGEIGGLVLVAIVIIVVLYFLSSFSGGGVGSTSTDEMSDLYFEDDEELKNDFTNEDVQQWLRTNGGLDQLEEWAEDDLARLVHEGEDESHYAVLNVWWYEMAQDLGFEEPEADEEYTEFTIAIAFTSAYEVHSDRVGDVPELDDGAIGTSPFLVEHDHQAGATESERLGERTESELI